MSRLSDVDRRRVDRSLDVGSVIFFDHFDTRAAVLGNLVNVGSLHQTKADVGVAKAVRRPALAVAIDLEVEFVENRVEKLSMVSWEDEIGGGRIVPFLKAPERNNGARRALAEPDSSFPADLDFQDALLCAVVPNDRDVAMFKSSCFVGT